MRGTYSPEDNKLRLYSGGRLDPDLYARVRAAGFIWAPRQELFVAPMWTPQREDLLIELCEDIGDEDTSLTTRAEERAERFEDYSDKRADDADRAKNAVNSITQNVPFGQPILIGHHSEKRARKDADKITNGMRRAVKMWEQSEYWKDRAAGAIGNAKYKERPDVRARRVKGLEADKRRQEKDKKEAESFLNAYNDPEATTAKLRDGRPLIPALLGTYEGGLSHEEMNLFEKGELSLIEALEKAYIRIYARISWADRWINHYTNRIMYEKAMMAETGGTVADKKGPEKGGAVKCWASLSYGRGWSYILKVNKVSVTISNKVNYGDRVYTQTIPFDKLSAIMTAAEVEEKRAVGLLFEDESKTGFILAETATPKETSIIVDDTKTEMNAMKETLKEGVKIIVAPQLFPTPPAIAEKMVELAGIEAGMDILEPSAGTGNIINAMPNIRPNGTVTAVEINYSLSKGLEEMVDKNTHADFLDCNGNLGKFDRIIMNPPFENGVDIKHIRHALTFLRPGGRLVALCANGSRQREAFKEISEYWEDLPEGSFKVQGTGVNVALLVLEYKGGLNHA